MVSRTDGGTASPMGNGQFCRIAGAPAATGNLALNLAPVGVQTNRNAVNR